MAEVIAALAVLAVFALAIAPLMNLRLVGQSIETSVREACAAAFLVALACAIAVASALASAGAGMLSP